MCFEQNCAQGGGILSRHLGTVRRSVDTEFIHSNVDTDVIISENPAPPSTRKPEELYSIIQRFCLGRKRIELFGQVLSDYAK